ncbi:MAG: hypothetical protein NT027_02230 [Proteobacteria bacterium]|nr:hypothetical protein [Pseudomonadota bacterium]
MISFRPIWWFYFVTIILLSSFLSVGFFHPDEHFQIIEFANHLLGRGSEVDNIWEFSKEIRPWFQPVLVASILKVCFEFTNSPFLSIAIVKICFGTMLFASTCLVARNYSRKKGFSDAMQRRLFFSLFLLSPILGFSLGRTSSESFSAACLGVIVGLILNASPYQLKNSLKLHATMASLFTMMFFIRYQMAFAYLGIFLWFQVYVRPKWSVVLTQVFISIAVSLIFIGLDSALYGHVVLTPWNYFYTNIIEGAASNFGVSPWYAYLIWPPTNILSIFVLMTNIAAVVLVFSGRYSIFLFIYLSFLMGHSIIAHKELRFLLPVLIIAPALWFDAGRVIFERISVSLDRSIFLSKLLIGTLLGLQILEAVSPQIRSLSDLAKLDLKFRFSNLPESPCVEWMYEGKTLQYAGNMFANFYRASDIQIIDRSFIAAGEESIGCKTETFYQLRRETVGWYLALPDSAMDNYRCEIDGLVFKSLLSVLSGISLPNMLSEKINSKYAYRILKCTKNLK